MKFFLVYLSVSVGKRRGLLELNQSKGIDDLGRIKWDIALCLLVVYLICYFSLWKGISTSGKASEIPYSTVAFRCHLTYKRKEENKQLFCSTSPMLLITFTLQFFFSFSPYRRKTNGRRAPAGCLVHGALPVRCSLYPFGAGNNAAGISRRHPLLPIAQLRSTQKSRGGLFLSD